MISFALCRSFEPREWERLVEACNGHSLHLPQVHLTDFAERDMRFLLAKEADTTVGCGLAFEISRSLLRWKVGTRTLSLPAGLALADEVIARRAEAYRALMAFARGSGYARIIVARGWGEDFSNDTLFSRCITNRGLDFTIDLTKTAEELRGAMHKYHRKNIRRAERKDIEIVAQTSVEALLRLRELQANTVDRKGLQAGVRDEDFFRRLHSSTYHAGPGEILFAKMEGQYVAGLAYLSAYKKAQTVRSGSTDVGNKIYATYLLQFDLMIRLKEAGVEVLNIGAVPAEAVEADHPQHGLYKFKQGFGGVENLRTAVDVPLKSFAVPG